MMISLLLLITTALAAGLGAVLPTGIPFIGDKSLLCNPRKQPILYTGFRVYEAAAISFPVRHYWYIIKCTDGKVTDHQYFPSKRNDNFMFAQELCLGDGKCFSISRRKKYSNRDVPVYRPFSQIGALYKSVNNVTTDLLLPVHGDNTANLFTIGTMRYMPLLYTGEGLVDAAWERRVCVKGNEKYCITRADKKKLWYKMNRYLTISINKLSLKKQLAFWEFDPVKLQLMGIDWRRPINQWFVCKNWKKKNGKRVHKSGHKPRPLKNCTYPVTNCAAKPVFQSSALTRPVSIPTMTFSPNLGNGNNSFNFSLNGTFGTCVNPDSYFEYSDLDLGEYEGDLDIDEEEFEEEFGEEDGEEFGEEEDGEEEFGEEEDGGEFGEEDDGDKEDNGWEEDYEADEADEVFGPSPLY